MKQKTLMKKRTMKINKNQIRQAIKNGKNIKTRVFAPTRSQAVSLLMSDYIHPLCKINAKKGNKDYNDFSNIMLDSGTRGSGKTDGKLWEIKGEVDKGFGREWTGVVFRKNMNDLKDIQNMAEGFFSDLGYKFKMNRSASPEIKFATGERLLFRMLRNEDDYNKHHGFNYQYILFEEATLWHEIMDLVYSMMSTLRTPYNEKYKREIEQGKKHKLILKMRLTTNPFGSGKLPLKRVFVDNQNYGVPFVKNGITYIHMLSSYLDNPYIDDAYINNFKDITNKEKKRAWVYADWNAKTSGAFGDLYKEELFNLRPFDIPANWDVFRSMDWGRREPFSVLWWAVADGGTSAKRKILKNGQWVVDEFCPPEGTMILIYEWYGCDPDSKNNNVGLKMNAKDVAIGIKEIDEKLKRGILKNIDIIEEGPADNSIYAEGGHGYSIGEIFESEDLYWESCIKDRVAGVEAMIEIMQNTLTNEPDMRHLYVFGENCPFWIENVMSLEYNPKKPDDVMTDGVPDHDFDSTKYALFRDRGFEYHSTNG